MREHGAGDARSPGPTTVVLRRTARRAVRSGVLWGYVFGIFVASSAISYSTIYKTRAERDRLAAVFGSNHAVAALFGPAPRLQTVAGFTVFKTALTLTVVGAVWGLLTSTKLLRGEEDAGRWELVLAGRITGTGALRQALGGLAAGVGSLWAVASVVTVVTGRSSKVHIAAGPALFFVLALVSGAVMFLALGALTSQLASTRRQAAAYAGWVLGAGYALRMVADAGGGLHGLIWVTPLGWIEELRPLTSPRPLALVPIAAFTAASGAAAVVLAGRRDVGAGIRPDRPHARARLGLLSGSGGLAVRLLRPTVVAWSAAIAATGLLFGLVAKSAGSTISGSSVERVFTKLGAPGTGIDTYLGVSFLIMAVLAGFVAGGQITAARAEEAEGRLDHILAGPVSRWSWLWSRLGVALVVVVAIGALAGVSTWIGVVAGGSGVSFARLMGAGFNVVPPALFILGVGAFTIGLRPRAAAPAVYAVLGWSLLVELVGGIGALDRWVLDTSLFHQMTAAPAVAPDWTTGTAMAGIGVVLALGGSVALSRRDVEGA